MIVDGGPDLGTGTMSERLTILRDNFDEYRRAVRARTSLIRCGVGGLLCEQPIPNRRLASCSSTRPGTLECAVMARSDFWRLSITWDESRPVCIASKLRWTCDSRSARCQSRSDRERREFSQEGWRVHRCRRGRGGRWRYRLGRQLVLPCELAARGAQPRSSPPFIRPHVADSASFGRTRLSKVDHIELFAPPQTPDAHSKNYVHCPGGAYDRSPCGTGRAPRSRVWLPMESSSLESHGSRRVLLEADSIAVIAGKKPRAKPSFHRSWGRPSSMLKPAY